MRALLFDYRNGGQARNITFRDVCARGKFSSPAVPELNRIATALAPCGIISPLDCYWEGSLLREPDVIIAPVNTKECLANSPTGYYASTGVPRNVTWGNLNFDTLRECLGSNYTASGFSPFLNQVHICNISCSDVLEFTTNRV